jgi:hypothetical protein
MVAVAELEKVNGMKFKYIYLFAFCVLLLSFCAPQEPLETEVVPSATAEVGSDFAVKEVDFSLNQTSDIPPEDLAIEIGYFPPLANPEITCETVPKPGVCYAPDEVEWLESFSIVTSGWKYKEEIQISINIPDGRQITALGTAEEEETFIYYGPVGQFLHRVVGNNDRYLFNYVFQPDLGMPIGKYEFVFEGETVRVEKTVDISIPAYPRALEFGENRIVLSGFLP